MSLADELKSVWAGVKVDLQESSGGVFEVTVDGKKVFSKKESGRFPQPGEVRENIKAAVGA